MEKQHLEHWLWRSPRKAWEGRASKRLLRPFSPSCGATQPPAGRGYSSHPCHVCRAAPRLGQTTGTPCGKGLPVGPAPVQRGVTSGLGRGCAGGLPLHPTAGGGAAGPQETSCPRLGAPHPVFTVLCAHPGLRQPRPSPDSRGASGEGLGVRGLQEDPPRQPGPAPRAGQGPAPPQHPAPAPHSRCLAPHQFQAWGPSHGAGAPPGHTTWPTSSSLATSTLTEPLTQPQHPAVPSCSPALCAARPAVHLAPPPRLHLSPCSASAQAALPQGCRELLSAREQEPRDSSSSSQALTARSGSPDLGRFPLERAATHAHPALKWGCSKGIAPAGLEAGGVRGWGRMGLSPTTLCAPPWLC